MKPDNDRILNVRFHLTYGSLAPVAGRMPGVGIHAAPIGIVLPKGDEAME